MAQLLKTPYVRRDLCPATRVRPEGRWPDLDSAYHAMRAELPEATGIAAWKLGGTNRMTQKTFGVDSLYFGPLLEGEVFAEGDPVDLPLIECQGEAEIAIRISQDGFDAWCLCLEMPSSPIADLPAHGVETLVADRCAAGALALGPVRDLSSLPMAGRVSICVGEQELVRGMIGMLTSPILRIAQDFCIRARALGFGPRAGQWIVTGGLTPCIPLPREGEVDLLIDHRPVLSVALNMGRPPC